MKSIIFGAIAGCTMLIPAAAVFAGDTAADSQTTGTISVVQPVTITVAPPTVSAPAPVIVTIQNRPGFPAAQITPTIAPDARAYGWDDTKLTDTSNSNGQAGTYQGEWTGDYIDAEGRTFKGEWTGSYTGEDGRVYRGTYRGTAIGEPAAAIGSGVSGLPSAAGAGDGAIPSGYERYEQCLRGRGLTGAAIGGILGGILGNRIAGRGNRLLGTATGGVAGALAGVVIEKAVNKCRKHLPRQFARPAFYPPYGYAQPVAYYYQQPAPVITTITITPGSAALVETTGETTDESAAHVADKGKGLRRPAATAK